MHFYLFFFIDIFAQNTIAIDALVCIIYKEDKP